MAEGFRFIYLAFGFSYADNLTAQCIGELGTNLCTGVDARARAVCVVHRCQNKNPRSKGGPVDVNDVMHRKRARKIWEIFEKVSWVEFCLGRRWLTFICSPRPCVGCARVGGCRWKSQKRKNEYLSSYVEEPLNSMVIKIFVPELRNRKCFSWFGIPMLYVYMLWTFYVRFTYLYLAMVHIHRHQKIVTREEI